MTSRRGRGDDERAIVVLVVDDHEGMRGLIRTIFELDRPDDVVHEATSAQQALALWRSRRPDVIILDQILGNDRGVADVAEPILADDPEQPIILFSAFLTNALRDHAHAIGVARCATQDDVRDLPKLALEIARTRPRE